MSAVLEDTTTEIDTDQMSTDLAADLGLNLDTSNREADDALIDRAADTVTARDETGKFTRGGEPDAVGAEISPPQVVDELPVPKSWAKEMHPIWDKMAKGVPLTAEESKSAAKYYRTREEQMEAGAKAYGSDAEFGRSLKSVISKHEDILRSQGLDAPRAVEFLFNAHRNLSMGTQEQKQAYLERVAKSYGLTLGQTVADPANAEPPSVRELRERQERIEAAINADNQRRYQEQASVIQSEVNTFASDPKNIYFEECADHICMLLKADPTKKLASAYEEAVWANPVTRQKELARLQQEREAEARKKTEAAVKAAKKGTSPNVRGRDTGRAPTAPAASLANLDDVMRETQEEIRSRA